ncbi:hypothetical protein C9415_06675 [Kluyvera sp. Nf5]|nr:hypothetical protein C9415_06675 [Kluyvera sp. Nf5]
MNVQPLQNNIDAPTLIGVYPYWIIRHIERYCAKYLTGDIFTYSQPIRFVCNPKLLAIDQLISISYKLGFNYGRAMGV